MKQFDRPARGAMLRWSTEKVFSSSANVFQIGLLLRWILFFSYNQTLTTDVYLAFLCSPLLFVSTAWLPIHQLAIFTRMASGDSPNRNVRLALWILMLLIGEMFFAECTLRDAVHIALCASSPSTDCPGLPGSRSYLAIYKFQTALGQRIFGQDSLLEKRVSPERI